VGAAVVNDFDIADRADAFEEVLKVFFGGFVGQIAEVDAGAGDFAALASFSALWALGPLWAFAPFTTFRALTALTALTALGPFLGWAGCSVGIALACVAGVRLHFARRTLLEADALLLFGTGRADGFLVKAEGLQDLLPPGQWDGLVFAARRTGSAFATISTALTTVAAVAVALMRGAVRVVALFVVLPVAIPAFASAGALSATFASGASGASGIRCGV
jgi:hypothetical protein